MGLFSRKQTQSTETNNSKPVIPANHVSKKKKNTYQIALSGLMCDISCFCLCPNTPLAGVVLNGKKLQDNTGFLSCTQFPNPFAYQMQNVFSKLSPMDKKTASTIIEYLDKETNQPVALLFPHGLHIKDGFEEKYMDCLNHATRRDLAKQIAIRQNLIEQLNQKAK